MCREMPRCRISTSRWSCHSSSGSVQGRVSRPAASSVGGLNTNRTVLAFLAAAAAALCLLAESHWYRQVNLS
jgi:hypothetical protein